VPITVDDAFAGAVSVFAEDLDGDGALDIAGCGWVADEIAVWYGASQGGSWTKQTVASGFAACHWVDAADLDDDGDVDLLGAAADGNEVAVWINSGEPTPAWTHQSVEVGYRGARSLVPSDLDGDGDVDLIGTALLDNDVSWWRNDGGEPIVWTRDVLSDSLDGAHHAGAWDMDLDGDMDILAAGFGSPWLVLWRNDGSDPPGWGEETFGAPIVAPLVIDVGDLDGDGDLDVVATSNTWGRLIWWHNDGGSPAGWPATYIGVNFANAWPVAIADLDGNGALDVTSGASGATEVAWWRLTDFAHRGTVVSRVLSIPTDVVTLTCALDSITPSGTDVGVEVRVGADPVDLGPWIAIEPSQEIHLMARGPTHLQYRLTLSTSDPAVAPVVEGIAFEWSSELIRRQSPRGRLRP
jgi:hypothetical protein